MKGGDQSSAGKPSSRASGPQDTNVDIPGYKRVDFADGSYVLEGQHGEQVLVSESGNMSVNVPSIRRVQIDDLSQVVRHEVVQVHDTISHTVHLVGNGVFGYLHLRNGQGLSIEGRNVAFRICQNGVILVLGSATNRNAGNRSPRVHPGSKHGDG
ncbi:hypothetical protein [Burkholderia cepacia]|uniref:hypothetical protein n=1 Tax=Burkholderia cepacia TaxID=292 RepID=UPI001782021F|nr:hypothetical protein [Burkholderia cepacia]QOH34989.1 hypothetical protein C7S14_5020 [Burkholderia cepacia]